LIEHLIKEFKHVQKGETVGALMRAIDPDMSEAAFRKLIRKLETRRYLMTDNTGNYGRARKGMLVKLRGQDFKNRWKGAKEGLLKRLEKPLPSKTKGTPEV
jgi:hypothetical protein